MLSASWWYYRKRQEWGISLPTPATISSKSYRYEAAKTKNERIETVTYNIDADEALDQRSQLSCLT